LPRRRLYVRFPPKWGVQGRGLLGPLYVDSSRPERANGGHSPTARRTGQIDPKASSRVPNIKQTVGKLMPFASVRRRGVIGRLISCFARGWRLLWPGEGRTARGGVHEIA
jgi:hypothetical protein